MPGMELLPPTRPSANRTPTLGIIVGPRCRARNSWARWGSRRKSRLMRNPFGNTSRCGTATTMPSSCWSTASTAKVEGNVPSDGRSQAGGNHRRSEGSGGSGGCGRGSKKLIARLRLCPCRQLRPICEWPPNRRSGIPRNLPVPAPIGRCANTSAQQGRLLGYPARD
jgi:hypothetical protein